MHYMYTTKVCFSCLYEIVQKAMHIFNTRSLLKMPYICHDLFPNARSKNATKLVSQAVNLKGITARALNQKTTLIIYLQSVHYESRPRHHEHYFAGVFQLYVSYLSTRQI